MTELRKLLGSRRNQRLIAILIVAIAGALGREGCSQGSAPGGTMSPEAIERADSQVEQLYEEQRSKVVVEIAGTVDRTLADDLEGSRHQRFILRLASGHTVLVSHNIDLAEKIPLSRGDTVQLRGQYEWNDRGGVVHWTHHDPGGRRPGGWIDHAGRRYR